MTTWVLLRGLMREARHWGEFPALVQQAVAAEQLVTLDFPGNGQLHTEHSATLVIEMVEHCRAQLKKLGYTPPYSVLALSLGAMVALEWSTQYPSEVKRMVLINTSLASYSPFYHRLHPRNYPALIRYLLCGTTAQREALILQLTSMKNRTQREQAELLAQWISYAQECPVTRTNILRQLLAAMTYRPTAEIPVVPVLLLAGEQDHLVNVQCSITLAQRWGAVIRLHPTAGHDLPLDDGAWVAQQMQSWLA